MGVSVMKNCSYCGRENTDGAVHCPDCGTEFVVKVVRVPDSLLITGYKLGLLALILVSVYSLYATVFFGWSSATPHTASEIARIKHDCYAWFWIFVFSVIVSIFVIVKMVGLRRKARDRISA
jgi:hypothetical protein